MDLFLLPPGPVRIGSHYIQIWCVCVCVSGSHTTTPRYGRGLAGQLNSWTYGFFSNYLSEALNPIQ